CTIRWSNRAGASCAAPILLFCPREEAGGTMLSHLLLLAEQTGDAPASPQGGLIFSLLPLAVIGVLFWFLMVRPMKRQEHERQALLGALKKNDKVVTSGGIIGIVAAIKD